MRAKHIILTIVIVLTATSSVFAADEKARKLLSMEDAILNRDLIPERYNYSWCDNSKEYIVVEQGKRYRLNISTGKRREMIETQVKSESKACVVNRGNNIVYNGADGNEVKITDFADPNIVAGQSVSRNEFGIHGGIFFSPDSLRVAFYQKDESRVTTFPLLDITSRTGTLVEIKYPMNGMASERVSVGVFDIVASNTIYLNVTDFDEERYLTNLTWSPDGKKIYLQVLDRKQKNMRLNRYDALSGEFEATLLEEHNDRFVEPQYPLYFIDSDRFIYTTKNRDGYQSLYLYTLSTNELERITNVDADVEYITHRNRYIYYYSAEISPLERHMFRYDLKTKKILQLTFAVGWHTCDISPDGRYFMDEYSSLTVPRVYELATTNGIFRREEFRADDPTKDYNYRPVEFGKVKSADGKYENYYRMIRPLGFDPNKKYPVILYVYGGPHSQLVRNTFQGSLRRWEMYMAQRGYIVFVMDNRGTANRGTEYENAIYGQCGKCEMEDQMEGIKWLLKHSWVDKERIGVHGWSYGGFMTISLMVNYPEIFKVGVAGGPVIDWKWYEVMYGERYMGTQASNPEGFASTSLLSRAKDLRGHLLICQGAMDDTVVWQHSLSFIDECIRAGVPVDYFPYPRSKHNVFGKDRVHLMNKVTAYFDDYLR